MIHENDHAELGRQLHLSMRRLGRLHARMREPADCGAGSGPETSHGPYGGAGDAAGAPVLERAAYVLLGRIASDGPARLSALAAATDVDVSTASRQVAALEMAGLVGRHTDPADRRVSLITATPAGLDIFASVRRRWHGLLERVLTDWEPDELREFVRLLAKFNNALSDEAFEDADAGVAAGRGSLRPAGETTEGRK